MEDFLLQWRSATLSWHKQICPCSEPWKHLLPPGCTPTTADRGDADGADAGSQEGVESLLSAAAFLADEGGSSAGNSKDVAWKDWYIGTPL